MQRTDRIALLTGAVLVAGYLLIAALGTVWHQSPRPLYDGPCPPTVCTPCPGFQCSYTSSTQTPPPSTSSSHTTTQTTQTTQTTTQPSSTTHSTTNASSTTTAPSSSTSGPSPPGSSTSAASSSAGSSSASGTSSTTTVAPAGTPSAGVIGPGGGLLASPDGSLVVQIPPGALTKPATMRVLAAKTVAPTAPSGRTAVGQPWAIDGSDSAGPVSVFAKPIQVVLHYTDTDPEFMFYWDGASWNALQTMVDSGGKTATATVPHLTVFAAFTAMGASSSGGGSGAGLAIALVVALVVVIAVVAVISRRRGAAPQ